MTKKIDSAGVLYKRKSPPTYTMRRGKFLKNMQSLADSGDALRKTFATDAEWWAFLDAEDMRDSYLEAKEWAEERKRKGVV